MVLGVSSYILYDADFGGLVNPSSTPLAIIHHISYPVCLPVFIALFHTILNIYSLKLPKTSMFVNFTPILLLLKLTKAVN